MLFVPVYILNTFYARYMFLEYGSLTEAKEAVKTINGHRLDKNHVFAVNLFSDFDKYTTVSDEWVEPEVTPYKDPVSFIPTYYNIYGFAISSFTKCMTNADCVCYGQERPCT